MIRGLLDIAVYLVITTVVIGGHEAGHWVAALVIDVDVAEVSVGFGPRLVSMRRRGTAYSLRALPIGGFVILSGSSRLEPPVAGPRAFLNVSVARRAAIVLAGVIASVVLGGAMLAAATAADHVVATSTSGAALSGIQGVPRIIADSAGGLFSVITDPGSTNAHAFYGPVGLARITPSIVDGGIPAIVGWIGYLSVSLAILDLLPILPLDGGRLVLELLDGARRRAVSVRQEVVAVLAGAVLVAALLVLMTINDLRAG